MYDVELREELLNFKKGIHNINTLNYLKKEMKKIIKCRTQDKIDLLNYLLNIDLIDFYMYKKCLQYTQDDFVIANRYLLGLCSI